MGSISYHKYIAYTKGWVNNSTAKHRVKWAKVILPRYPNPADWEVVRFSDEVHFRYGPQGKIHIIRKPGERYYPDYLQQQDSPAPKDTKRIHC